MSLFLALVLSYAWRSTAHTWIEQLTNVSPDGTYVADFGYARAFVDRGPGFNEEANNWLVPPPGPSLISQTHLLCHPSQRDATQSPNYPRLHAPPGGTVALRYLENGHVTLAGDRAGKPDKGGTVFVFGTQQPYTDEKLLDVLRWTRDGQGGDGRGALLTAQNFDDDRCYELGNSSPLAESRKKLFSHTGVERPVLCETDVQLPETLPPGEPYTLYWVWQWPTMLKGTAQDEYYVSCIDVNVALDGLQSKVQHTLSQQDAVTEAVPAFQSRTALTTDPLAFYTQPAVRASFTPSL